MLEDPEDILEKMRPDLQWNIGADLLFKELQHCLAPKVQKKIKGQIKHEGNKVAVETILHHLISHDDWPSQLYRALLSPSIKRPKLAQKLKGLNMEKVTTKEVDPNLASMSGDDGSHIKRTAKKIPRYSGKTKVKNLPTNFLNKLKQNLDIEERWKLLAVQLGYSSDDVGFIDMKTDSPTEHLILHWLQEHPDADVEDIFSSLHKMEYKSLSNQLLEMCDSIEEPGSNLVEDKSPISIPDFNPVQNLLPSVNESLKKGEHVSPTISPMHKAVLTEMDMPRYSESHEQDFNFSTTAGSASGKEAESLDLLDSDANKDNSVRLVESSSLSALSTESINDTSTSGISKSSQPSESSFYLECSNITKPQMADSGFMESVDVKNPDPIEHSEELVPFDKDSPHTSNDNIVCESISESSEITDMSVALDPEPSWEDFRTEKYGSKSEIKLTSADIEILLESQLKTTKIFIENLHESALNEHFATENPSISFEPAFQASSVNIEKVEADSSLIKNQGSTCDNEILSIKKPEMGQNDFGIELQESKPFLKNAEIFVENNVAPVSNGIAITESLSKDRNNAELSKIMDTTEITSKAEPAVEKTEIISKAEPVVEMTEISPLEEPVIDTAEIISKAEPVIDTMEIISPAEPVIDTTEIISPAEPVIDTTEILSKAEPVIDTTEIISKAEPVIDTTEIISKAEPVIDMTEIISKAEPVVDTTEIISKAEPVVDTTEIISKAEPVVDTTEIISKAEPVVDTTEIISKAEPVVDTTEIISKAEPVVDTTEIISKAEPVVDTTEIISKAEPVVDTTEIISKAEPVVDTTEIISKAEPVVDTTEIISKAEPVVDTTEIISKAEPVVDTTEIISKAESPESKERDSMKTALIVEDSNICKSLSNSDMAASEVNEEGKSKVVDLSDLDEAIQSEFAIESQEPTLLATTAVDYLENDNTVPEMESRTIDESKSKLLEMDDAEETSKDAVFATKTESVTEQITAEDQNDSLTKDDFETTVLEATVQDVNDQITKEENDVSKIDGNVSTESDTNSGSISPDLESTEVSLSESDVDLDAKDLKAEIVESHEPLIVHVASLAEAELMFSKSVEETANPIVSDVNRTDQSIMVDNALSSSENLVNSHASPSFPKTETELVSGNNPSSERSSSPVQPDTTLSDREVDTSISDTITSKMVSEESSLCYTMELEDSSPAEVDSAYNCSNITMPNIEAEVESLITLNQVATTEESSAQKLQAPATEAEINFEDVLKRDVASFDEVSNVATLFSETTGKEENVECKEEQEAEMELSSNAEDEICLSSKDLDLILQDDTSLQKNTSDDDQILLGPNKENSSGRYNFGYIVLGMTVVGSGMILLHKYWK